MAVVKPVRWPAPRYEVQVTFSAPLEFTYRWCTQYSALDGKYSGEGYERRILRRSRREITFEDLYRLPRGWIWIHRVVRLLPPDRWHADSIGSDRALSVDYRLTALSGGRTRLTIRARRRPYGIGTTNPPKAVWERWVAKNWESLGRALRRDYLDRPSR